MVVEFFKNLECRSQKQTASLIVDARNLFLYIFQLFFPLWSYSEIPKEFWSNQFLQSEFFRCSGKNSAGVYVSARSFKVKMPKNWHQTRFFHNIRLWSAWQSTKRESYWPEKSRDPINHQAKPATSLLSPAESANIKKVKSFITL